MLSSRRIRRAPIVALVTAGLVAGSVAAATGAQAAGGLPSGTTMSVSPSSVAYGTPVTYSATVKVLGLNGLGITPTGSITFSVKNAAGTVAPIGTAPISSCLLTACTATLTSAAAPFGTTTALANYPGDGVVAPSSTSTPFTVGASNSGTVVCYPSQPCDTGTVSSSDQSTTSELKTPGSSGFQTLSVSVGSGALHCVEPPDNEDSPRNNPDADDIYLGALTTFSSSASDVVKTLIYTGTGAVAANMQQITSKHPTHAGCYGSPTPFQGFVNGQYTTARFVTADQLYEAVLATCEYSKKFSPDKKTAILPCNTPSGNSTSYTWTVTAPPGDPKFI